MAVPVPEAARWPLLGGALCLDFANTLTYRGREREHDELVDYPTFLRWGRHAGAVGDAQARALLATATRQPAAAAAALARARALRETMARIFVATAHTQAPIEAELDALSAAWVSAMAHARLRRGGGDPRQARPPLTWIAAMPDSAQRPAPVAFDWRFDEDGAALDRPLWPVLQSAVTLLTAQDLTRLRRCASAAGCGWLFLDATRNRSRRWCDAAVCGNRERARRHYARSKGEHDS
jgi:predicted RNA-binding Zn ribbon-like protein